MVKCRWIDKFQIFLEFEHLRGKYSSFFLNSLGSILASESVISVKQFSRH